MKKIISVTTAVFVLFSSMCARADTEYDDTICSVARTMCKNVPNPTVSAVGGEWAVLGLARSGESVDAGYFEKYAENVSEYLKKSGGVLHEQKYTEYSRVILALSAIGENPSDFSGCNLLAPLADYEKTVQQGLNGAVWALIALDCGDYEIPQNEEAGTRATRELYIQKILASQNSDGGFSLSEGLASEADMTAMALCALSDYAENAETAEAIDAALEFLSESQDGSGGFKNRGVLTAESAAQVICAMCELGISVGDSRFVKNGNSVIDNLMSFYDGAGGFMHKNGGGTNQMATEQALYALAAYRRSAEEKNTLYDMSDAEKREEAQNISEGLPGKHSAVKKTQYLGEKSFSDIAGRSDEKKLAGLAARGIINGKSSERFAPEEGVTRAELAKIVVGALGIEDGGSSDFSDVAENDWFYGAVSAAYRYGIITGVSEREFNPYGHVTKEAAAVMIMRAGKLAGLDTEYADERARDTLAAFDDYMTISPWARQGLAFCCDSGILEDDALTAEPKKEATRAEICVMIYNMLDASRLL